MADQRPPCLSKRIVEGQNLQCTKGYGHPGGWHLSYMDDETAIKWEGASSFSIVLGAASGE